ncbi:MAG: phosphoribosylglycinamide synthetase C domain-containing protein, partial [Terriglobales bacterium]
LMESDLFEALWACTEGCLDEVAVRWSSKASCCVVAAAQQYPSASSKGEPIEVQALPENTFLYHAGTKVREDGRVVTDGGRVLAVTAVAPDMEAAQKLAYNAIEAVKFKDIAYRTDIARRALKPCVSS